MDTDILQDLFVALTAAYAAYALQKYAILKKTWAASTRVRR